VIQCRVAVVHLALLYQRPLASTHARCRVHACKPPCCLIGSERRSALQRMCTAAKHQRKQQQSCLCCHAAPSHVHDALTITAQQHEPIMAWPFLFLIGFSAGCPPCRCYMLQLHVTCYSYMLLLAIAGVTSRHLLAAAGCKMHHRCGAMCQQLLDNNHSPCSRQGTTHSMRQNYNTATTQVHAHTTLLVLRNAHSWQTVL